jgi:N-acetyl-gamma-glutamyl-phosphate reductase
MGGGMTFKVFVDGQEGTTGLKIRDHLVNRKDLLLLEIEPGKRKDASRKKDLLNEADIVFLCLPDVAAKDSVGMVSNPQTKIIDASTAHRTNPDWVYGIPELSKEQRERICNAKRVSVPGCHATGFIMPLNPLVSKGIVPRDYPFTCQSLTGYSGGGKKLISAYEDVDYAMKEKLRGPRPYALGLAHKHIPEMQKHADLENPPLFLPVVGNFYQGMLVSIPLFRKMLKGQIGAKDIHAVLQSHYAGQSFVNVMPLYGEGHLSDGFLDPSECNGTNRLEIFVFGNSEQILLISRFDNLGKGASGAAVQNMNLMLGLKEEEGLI